MKTQMWQESIKMGIKRGKTGTKILLQGSAKKALQFDFIMTINEVVGNKTQDEEARGGTNIPTIE